MTAFKRLLSEPAYDTFFFIAICSLLSLLQIRYGLDRFHHDALHYWETARDFDAGGTFSIYNYTFHRGILFPLVSYLLINLAKILFINEIHLFKIVHAVFICWGLWYVLPSLYKRSTDKIIHPPGKLLLVGLTHFFWFRYFSVPLTDFICFFLLLYVFQLLWTEVHRPVIVLIAGVICGYIFNTRPVYNTLLIVYPLFLFIVSRERIFTRVLKISIFLIGALLISLPQYDLNQKNWKQSTIFQPTEAYYQGESLYFQQLKWGLNIQKYETYVGPLDCYANPQVFFYADKQIAHSEKLGLDRIATYADFFNYLVQHPEKILLYGKHLFNGLDIQYNSAYVVDLKPNPLFALLNYLILFAGVGLTILCRIKLFATPAFMIISLYLLLTTLLIVPLAVEVRFMIPVYLFCYLIISAEWDTGLDYWKQIPVRKKWMIMAGAVVAILLCFCLSADTYANIGETIAC